VVRFPAGAIFFLLHSVQTGCGARPVSYPMGTGGFSRGAKRQGREADHSLPSSAEVKNGGAIPLLPIRLHGVVLNYLSQETDLPFIIEGGRSYLISVYSKSLAADF
jgi:hypothetical protein